jgi:hypothetical protein
LRSTTDAYAYLPIDGDVALDEGDAETGRACWTSFSTFLDDWLNEGCFVCFVVLDLCFETLSFLERPVETLSFLDLDPNMMDMCRCGWLWIYEVVEGKCQGTRNGWSSSIYEMPNIGNRVGKMSTQATQMMKALGNDC